MALPIAPALRALVASKYFWPALITGGFLGQTALSEVSKAGERGIAREEIALQRVLGESQAAATKKAGEESRRRTKEYTTELLKLKKGERTESRERDLLEAFMASQDRQVALIMQAVGSLAQQRPRYSPAALGGGGILGLLRS